MGDDHRAFLLQPFKQEVNNWYGSSNKYIQNCINGLEDNGGKSLLRLLLEVQKLKHKSLHSRIRADICNQYNNILNAIKNDKASTLWLLKHNFSSAKDLLEITKSANSKVLITDGFWIVQDNRKSGSISFWHTNLSKLLNRSENCCMKFETS